MTVGEFGEFVNETGYITDCEKKKAGNWRSIKENLTCCYEIIGDSVFWNNSAKGYRLLTEAEWEFAARSGGKNYKYSWGNDSIPMINGQKATNIRDETFKKAHSPEVKIRPC